MSRLEDGIEMLSHAGSLAKECRDCFNDPEIKDAVKRHTTGARLESLYITTTGQGKKKRYIAHATLEWSRACITVTGWGVSLRGAVMNALEKRNGQYGLWQPDEEENLPF
jgi:hypothetical protein